MEKFRPTELYVERGAEAYPQGRELLDRFSHLPLHWIDAHHQIEELRIAEKFARLEGGHRATLATKFAQVDDLLDLDHRGKTQVRFSVNPADLVRKVEIGTSPLEQRLQAANRMPTKMHYRLPRREEAAGWFRREIGARFPRASISYIV